MSKELTVEEMREKVSEYCAKFDDCGDCLIRSLAGDSILCQNDVSEDFEERLKLRCNKIDEVGKKVAEMQDKILEYCRTNRVCRSCKLSELLYEGNCFSDENIDRLKQRCDKIDELRENSESACDNVDHPQHYKAGDYECINVMVAVFGINAVRKFCLLNAFKYLFRCDKKNGVEDINKATWYLKKHDELCKSDEVE